MEEYRIDSLRKEEEKRNEERRIQEAKRLEEQRVLEEYKRKRTEYLKEISYWLSLSGYDFEEEVCKLYERIGYKAILTKGSGDGGIDILLWDKDQNKIVVQCKNHNKQIGPAIVRDLFGVLHAEKAIKAILICPSGFTQGVYDFAAGKPIELIDGEKLLTLYKGYS
jgi:restriction system protein